MATTDETVATPVAEETVQQPNESGAAEKDVERADEEECQAEFQPVVELNEVDTKTGEEEEEVRYKQRAKLFRHDKDSSQWKERGTGEVKILKHKENKRIRLLMRREKTYKICMNHYVNKDVELKENMGSERSWMWPAVDYADGDQDECILAIRFANAKIAQEFRTEYDEARDYMRKLIAAEGSIEKEEDEGKAEADEPSDDASPEEAPVAPTEQASGEAAPEKP
eukprot:Plantae.Rhodophyta-Purpureofilum_apyrenoidigerum.ctg29438.p1 GENE.Plantae.Rhodophyta-Purpureofilum_apyrenoidigerum.ctg29438~~Plantae.Rhodophyta-Purpureofilum_apyrenoidigerum.ctg29438.p1  ORF type:complete len:225 (+),score=58.26 Plantae.Rhodophyta-Purpureofilum_apyrenoidigerum.ctg29438:92-766(+)